jgi:hypothetical protein
MDEIAAIRFDFFNVWQGDSLFFLIVRILGLVDRWIDMVFEEMVLFSVVELVMLHEFLVKRMLADQVAVGKTVAHRVWNRVFGSILLFFTV